MNQNQTIIAARLIQSAAHITAVTRDNSITSLDKISDRQFLKISGVSKLDWAQIVENSGRKWVKAFTGEFMRAKKKEDSRIQLLFGFGGSLPVNPDKVKKRKYRRAAASV